MYVECVRATNTSVFVLTASTNNIAYTVHNSIALIFCIDCLDMPFNVHTKTLNYSKV